MLHVTDLTKDYPTPRGPLRVLDRVSLQMGPGDAAAIMGPSGSGKSSLLYILGALEPPSSGRVTLDGRNPFELAPSALAAFRNEQIGFVFQDHCLLPQCTLLENVLVPTLVSPKHTADVPPKPKARAEETERARELIARVGLADRLDHRPAELSGGERQRVAIARALIRQPRLLLCDEPTGNLDHASAEHVADLLLDLHRSGQTILVVVTHSAALAARLPRRFELRDGGLRQAPAVGDGAAESTPPAVSDGGTAAESKP
jgi:lipoprotein-releasing system ATP-binding protein